MENTSEQVLLLAFNRGETAVDIVAREYELSIIYPCRL